MKNSYLERLYGQGQYLKNNPNWDQEDVNWKLSKILPVLDQQIRKAKDKKLRIAEVGCGSGLLLKKLASLYPKCEFYGYDISPDVQKFWSHDQSNLFFEVRTLEEITTTFDLILLIDVIEHVPDPISFLENLQDKTENILIHLPLDLSALTIVYESGIISQRRKVGHIHYYTQGIAKELLSESRWSPVKIFFTHAWKDFPTKSLPSKLVNIGRRLFYFFNEQVTARVLGGNTLIILAEKTSIAQPLVSIIMPVYNAGPFLREAIDSCLKQTYANTEIIIIDDGSTDNTAETCKEYSQYKNLKYIKNDKNEGLIFSLNKAVNLSKGKYIARMDQDDISLPDRIKLQVEYMQRHPDVEVLGTDVVLMADIDLMFGKPRQIFSDGPSIEWSIISSCPLHHPTVMFNRNLLLNDVFSNELYDRNQYFAEDLGLWARILLANKKIQVLNKPLLLYRKHSFSMSTIYKTPQLNASIQIAKNYAKEKWHFEIGNHFLKSIRTRNQLDNGVFFSEAKDLIKNLNKKATKEISNAALSDIQVLCFECLHFLILKRESNRLKAGLNSLSFLISTFNLQITPKALIKFYYGLIRRFIYIKFKEHKFKNLA